MAETMKDFENELDASFRKIEEGDILEGTVVSVDEGEVVLDLNYYTSGVIAAEDYSKQPGFSTKESVHVGDVVKAMVKNKDDHGKIRLSRVDAVDVLAWDKLQELKDSKEIIDVEIKGIVKSGVIAYVEDVRGFIPASKLALGRVDNIEEYLNKHIQVQVIEVSKENKKLVLSAYDILRKKQAEERKNFVASIPVGFVTEGVVETIKDYGAFVKLDNGASGLVHVSQISSKRIKTPSEVLSEGDRVKVKVTANKEGKLSLSMKEAEDAPAEEIVDEKIEIPGSKEEATTSLASLFANIKLS